MQKGKQAAEVKITIIYVYFVIFLLFKNGESAVSISQRDSYEDAVDSYFLCEAVGHVQAKCSREPFEQYSHPLLKIMSCMSVAFMPAAILLYLINCSNLKAKVKEMKAIKALRSLSSTTPNTANSRS